MLLTSKQLAVESKKQFFSEARILKELSHPHILQFYGVIVTALPLTMIVGLCQSEKTSLFITSLKIAEINKVREKEKFENACVKLSRIRAFKIG